MSISILGHPQATRLISLKSVITSASSPNRVNPTSITWLSKPKLFTYINLLLFLKKLVSAERLKRKLP